MKKMSGDELRSAETEKTPDFHGLFSAFVENAQLFPALGQALAENLRVMPESVAALPVGFWPAHESFIFAERDHRGRIVGLTERYLDTGKKIAVKGSKRGLIYNPADFPTSAPRRNKFIRTEKAGVECPICGKRSGCLISDDDVDDPSVVLCPHESKGAVETRKTGYLHRRRASTSAGPDTAAPISPVLVVEGGSDVLAAKDLGYRVIGKPSASDGNSFLTKMLTGQDVVIFGDGDEVGRGGAEATFQALRPVCRSVTKVFPPDGVRDLRAWGPMREEFEAHVAKAGVKGKTMDQLAELAPLRLIQQWLRDKHTSRDGLRLLHFCYGNWYRWSESHYALMEKRVIERDLYHDFDNREVRRGRSTVPIVADDRFVGKLTHALERECFVDVKPDTREPFSLRTRTSMDLTRAVACRNGLYYPLEDRLVSLTPDIFLTSVLPADYNPRAKCELWGGFVNCTFPDDPECQRLLRQWFGYCLISDGWLESMMIFYGLSGSGKSTVSKVLQAILGWDRIHAMDAQDFSRQFGLAPLVGKYLVVVDEDQSTRRTDLECFLRGIKRITGGDRTPIEQKYKSKTSCQLFCKLLFASNQLPAFSDNPGALARRTNLLYFGIQPKEPDRRLKEKLTAELPGITRWAIDGLRDLLQTGEFVRPKACEERLEEFANLTNPLASMLRECCAILPPSSPPVFTPSQVLYELYQAWCRANGVKTGLSREGFLSQLKLYCGTRIRKDQTTVNGERKRGFWGIRIEPTGQGFLRDYAKQ